MFLTSLWRNVTRRSRVEADLDEEMRGVYSMLVDEKISLVVLTMGSIGLFATWPAARSALRIRPVELLHGD